jgi:glycosyltransferase involved in cell wall biosynthesis
VIASEIVHFIDSMDPQHGGPPAAVVSLAAAQRSLGACVRIATRLRDDHSADAHPLRADVPGAGAVHCEQFPFGFASFVSARSLLRGLGVTRAQPAIVHIHGLWRPELLVVSREAAELDIPYVVAPLGMLAPWSLAQKRVKKQLAWRIGWKRALDSAAAIHGLNEDEAAQVRALGVRTPVEIMPNGVFLEQIAGRSPGWPSAVPAGVPYVLFLGRLHEVKGLDVLADAFAQVARRLPGVVLVVAGPDAGRRDEFVRRIATLGIGDRVHLIGPVYGEAKWDLLANATCLCQPSRQEGFSMSIVEALGAGVPVVISEQCHFPEVARVGAGSVVSLDAQAVAHAIEVLIGQPTRRAVAGRAGRELVRAHYQWPDIARRSLALYDRLIGQACVAAR